jgi:MFS family permease
MQKRGPKSEVNKIGLVGFFGQIAVAAIVTIWAVYLESFLKNPSYVGFLTSLFILIGTITYIYGVPILEKYRKIALYTIIVLLFIISYLIFSLISNVWIIIIFGVIISILGSFKISLYGIIVRNTIKDKSVSKGEGVIYTLNNLAWFLTPILAGFIATRFGIKSVFIFSSVMFLISIFFLKMFKIKETKEKKKIDKNPTKVFLEFFKDKHRILSYVLASGLAFWWVLIYLYIPIHIYDLGLPETTIGYFLGAVIIPLILIEYYIGKLASKKGFKGIFILGYSILGISALTCFFITNIYTILIILSISSFGAGMIEPTTEAYFFDIIKKKERDKFYPQYNTAINLGSFIARVLSAIILLILPFKFVLLLFSLIMLSIAFLSSMTKKIIEEK